MTIDFDKLAEPFPANEVEWRVGNKAKTGKSATLLCYLTSRAVQDRLDKVCGPANWRDQYEPVNLSGAYTDKDGKVHQVLNLGFICTLSIRIDEMWVSKSDTADCTDIEALKGGVSGALKRAAVKWGIGRYLYGVDSRYHNIIAGYGPDEGAVYCPLNGQPGHILIPKLPAWALPPEKPKEKAATKPKAQTEQKKEEEPKKAPEVEGDPCPKCGHTVRKVGGGGYQDMRCAKCNHPCWEHEDPVVPATEIIEPDKGAKWTDLERKRFHARRTELGYADYDTLAAWVETLGTKTRPSAMTEEQRVSLLGWLGALATKDKVRKAYDDWVHRKIERESLESGA